MMWVRDLKSPPQALALFQVYQRFAPLTSFSGPIWRQQVDQDVSLQAFLMPGQSHGSFLHLRRGPTLNLRPPLLRVEGQLESLFPHELPLQQWLAQGTRWWLRNLGSVEVDNKLRLALLNGLAQLDRAAFPDLDAAIAYHPIVPLCDGSWLTLEALRSYQRVYCAEAGGTTPRPGWRDNSPIVQNLVASSLQGLLSVQMEFLEDDRPETRERWVYLLPLPQGSAELSLSKDADGWSNWWFAGQPRGFSMQRIFKTPTPAFRIVSEWSADPNGQSVPPLLLRSVRSAILKNGREILGSLVRAKEGGPQALDLAEVLLRNGLLTLEELGTYRLSDHTSLADLHSRRHHTRPAADDVVVENSPCPDLDLEPDPPYEASQLDQLHWSLKAGEGRLRVRFLPQRSGISEITVLYEDQILEHRKLMLFQDWPLSLELRLILPRRSDPEKWLESATKAFLDGLETPLRLLQTYPEAFHEICCLTGIALQSGRTPPGWVWDCLDSQGKSLGQQLDGSDPLAAIRELLES